MDKCPIISNFLKDLPLPTLSTEHKNLLEAAFSVQEILEVIKDLKKGSAPRPDGLSVLYYKAFAGTLAPYVAKFFNAKTLGSPFNSTLPLAIFKQDVCLETTQGLLLSSQTKDLVDYVPGEVDWHPNKHILYI